MPWLISTRSSWISMAKGFWMVLPMSGCLGPCFKFLCRKPTIVFQTKYFCSIKTVPLMVEAAERAIEHAFQLPEKVGPSALSSWWPCGFKRAVVVRHVLPRPLMRNMCSPCPGSWRPWESTTSRSPAPRGFSVYVLL